MKKIFAVILSFTLLFLLTACNNKEEVSNEQNSVQQTDTNLQQNFNDDTKLDELNSLDNSNSEVSKESNILIAYFSRVGNMNFEEDINVVTSASLNMKENNIVGNNEILAQIVQEVTGGELFFIETSQKYPAQYSDTTAQAKEEQNNNERPEISSHIEDMSVYDTIILIYPIWWGTLPQSVFTFLEEYDFSEKTIIPICTHEGSGLGNSVNDIEMLCPNSQVLEGFSIKGSNVSDAKEDIKTKFIDITQ